VTTDLKTWVASILDDGREQFVSDMGNLEPAERVRMYTNLMNYVLPKQQAANIQSQVEAEYEALYKLLKEAPEKAIDKIAAKVIKMKEENEK
jgi:hypothetical protein